jgi:hypothetical protein
MVIKMVFLMVFWLNAFPHRLGISQTLSPRTIVTELGIDYAKHCRIEYGQYIQTHGKHNNTMTTRTIGALALRPTGNQQGGYYFYSLMSGQCLHRTHWTKLPMPAEVRDRVHALARRANTKVGLKFTDSDGTDLDVLYPDDDDDGSDSDYSPDQDNDLSDASSEDSSYDNSDSDLPDNQSAELAGVNEPVETTGVDDNPVEPTGVDDDDEDSEDDNLANDDDDETEPVVTTGVGDEPTGVHADETPGVDNHPNLQEYVDKLEAELDAKIAGLDSDYESNDVESDTKLDETFEPIDND